MAPLALYYLVVTDTCRHGTLLFPRRPLTSSPPAAGGKARRGWKGAWMVLSGPMGGPIKGSPAEEAPPLAMWLGTRRVNSA